MTLPRIRHPWLVLSITAAAVIGAILAATAAVVPFSSETARRRVIEVLAARLDAEVELADLRIRVLPRFRAEGRGLAIRYKGRRDVPPMIAIKAFSAEGSVFDLMRKRIARVVVDELDVQIPPDRNREQQARSAPPRPSAGDSDRHVVAQTFVIDELVANQGQLVIIPRDPDKRPKVWSIHHLRMTDVALDRPMPFAATVKNAVPPGDIVTSGTFGPWHSDSPGHTPLEGRFTFARADLAVFKGISGILSAKGVFGGSLERIDVHGETDTPDFMVVAGGHRMPLRATYHATVDGTNGNTLLNRIDASFRQTSLVAKGNVVGSPGTPGRTVTLDILIDKGRLEDVMQMAVKGPQPPMTGALKVDTKFVLPPGDRDVVQKLQLDGSFRIADTRFTNADVQTKINELSRRTRGQSGRQNAERVSSRFAGAFRLGHSKLTIGHVTFDVPGAAIRLSGSYGLASEEIAFAGTAFTDAKISQMTTGFKSLLLKPVDLLFNKKGGGSAIPIKIAGTRSAPSFGLDKGRVFGRR